MLELFKPTTSKAYTTAYSLPKNINLIPSQWTTASSTIITYNWGVLGVDNSTFQATEFTFNCRPRDGVDYDKVFYTVYIRDANNNLIFHSRNVRANTSVKFTSNPYTIPYSQIAYRVELWVFMEDGSWLYRDDITSSSLTLQLNCLEQVEENTLPADWYGTGTAAFQNPMETMTTVVPSDYEIDEDTIEDSLDIPDRILSSMGFVIGIFTQILSLRYVTFMLCFVLVVGLLGWFLH